MGVFPDAVHSRGDEVVRGFRNYVWDTLKERVKPPMRVILLTLAYLSRARQSRDYDRHKDRFKRMFGGAFVIAAKVHSPPTVLGECHFLNAFCTDH
jgi:hypothetical protein